MFIFGKTTEKKIFLKDMVIVSLLKYMYVCMNVMGLRVRVLEYLVFLNIYYLRIFGEKSQILK